ncbi:error-prone DNA polymerase [Pseudoblastomonas halimionae]|uniref:Error-prone DNA polymerase n=1 Tax=Alteriqipengyuania halimionae TaxID=1926630 RepID=A0A6I4TYS9_9SPHN|nr:error-prone DNA polymerase [Alteriqipengyuania halimionae]MXP08830.1 DNA polymerase III subunit alpha [Alteriqipengyuania halimionae]
MPEQPLTPDRRTLARLSDEDFAGNARADYVELGITSCFSFLRGASDAVDLVLTAFARGYDVIGIADRNTLAGVVRLHTEATTARMRPVIGCRIVTVEGWQFLAYPTDRASYGRLSALLSKAKMHTLDGAWQDKGETHIDLAMLADHAAGVQLILIPPDALDEAFEQMLPDLAARLPTMRHIAAAYLYRGDDVARINRLDAVAKDNGLAILATNDVHYHAPERRPLQDVMTCIREKTTIANAGLLLHANAERYLKPPEEMIRLFAKWPHAITATREVADACAFNLTELAYEYPDEPIPKDRTPDAHLAALTREGAAWRYPRGVPEKVERLIARELELIGKLDIARYFLTIKDIIDFARGCDPPILCQGRGSAANSAVCYCLGITAVDPDEHELLFDRFISEERKEPPDIDVDFEHERREEVIQYIYNRYGRQRAGLCATVIHYRPRMAIREVGKVMGLSEDTTSALARTVWGSHGREIAEKHATEAGLDMADPQLRRVLALTEQMIGIPRHLSQHVGGFILTQGPLIESVPIGNGAMADRSFIEWDKDDIDALGILKIDVLALGMLTCLQKGFDLLRDHHGRDLTLATTPREDPRVYDMLVKGDSLGVFQVESRAQMNMLPRLKPRRFYDLVIEVAIVRPGPIQGDMVHPYLKRRRGDEAVEIPKPSPDHGPPDELSSILERTLGVPIFQEQAMKIALDAAKFSSVEANQLRKAMATFRSRGMVDELQDKMVGRMIERGYDPDFSERCFNQIRGFGEYGFPESHAASFAHLVYISSWMKCHYPAVFACALLNSQPMGFYAPAQIVRDAQEHGVEVRAVDVNHSGWNNTLEEFTTDNAQPPMRLGFRQVDGLREVAAAYLVAEREQRGAFGSIAELHTRTKLPPSVIERLAAADAFRSMGLDRRQALWDARALKPAIDLPLFAAADARDEGEERRAHQLPQMPLSEHVVADYQTMRLSLKAHPLSFLRENLRTRGFTASADLRTKNFRSTVKVSGVVLIRQRPGSAKGVCFITLEDETGVVNLVIWPDMMEKYRKVIMGARLMEVSGRVEMDDEVLHVIVNRMEDATWRLAALSEDLLEPQISRADEVNRPRRTMSAAKAKVDIVPDAANADCAPRQVKRSLAAPRQTHPRNVRILPKSRDFH